MARIRTVKPGFFTSRSIAALPDDTTRLAFIGLWGYVDDHGRGVDDARLVKAALFPLDDRQTVRRVEAILATLATHGKICRYEADGERFFEVCNWSDHQRVNRPTPSVIPGRNPHGTLAEPSVSPHDSLMEDSRQEGKGRERKGREEGVSPDGDRSLEEFWHTYPPRDGKRIGKSKAAERWAKLSDADRQAAIIGAGHLAAAIAAGGKFGPPDAERWLRDRKWADWQEPARVNGVNGHARPSPLDAAGVAARALMERNALPPCPACDSTGWCDTEAGVAPCPSCERVNA